MKAGPYGAAVVAFPSIDPSSIEPDPAGYLARAESSVPGIKPGDEKEIVWVRPDTKARTPISLVFVHGYDATKSELRPVPDIVASALGANLFYTRLAGNGVGKRAMADAPLEAWFSDFAEAVAIGRAIGERVVVMANSTGASLATMAAANPGFGEGIAAYVLTSPNYRLRAPGNQVLSTEWGQGLLAWALRATDRATVPAAFREWACTGLYLAAAARPVAAAAVLARSVPVEAIDIPTLFAFNDRDTVVSGTATREIAARWGAPHELLVLDRCGDPANHRLAGDEKSPETTEFLAQGIIDWLTTIGLR